MVTPRILVRRDDGTVRSIIIRGVAKIGAATGNEVVIQHAGVQPLHASVGVDAGALWVEDAGGPTGTKLNGERISRSSLRHLDVITIADEVHLVVLNNDIAGSDTRMVGPAMDGVPIDLVGATIQATMPQAAPVISHAIRGIQLAGTTGKFESAAGVCIVGRSHEATFRIDSKDVSRKHASIVVAAAGVTIEDLNSANGTSVNGQRITSRMPLEDGDKVAFATFKFAVTLIR